MARVPVRFPCPESLSKHPLFLRFGIRPQGRQPASSIFPAWRLTLHGLHYLVDLMRLQGPPPARAMLADQSPKVRNGALTEKLLSPLIGVSESQDVSQTCQNTIAKLRALYESGSFGCLLFLLFVTCFVRTAMNWAALRVTQTDLWSFGVCKLVEEFRSIWLQMEAAMTIPKRSTTKVRNHTFLSMSYGRFLLLLTTYIARTVARLFSELLWVLVFLEQHKQGANIAAEARSLKCALVQL